jgi:hypothetical protein
MERPGGPGRSVKVVGDAAHLAWVAGRGPAEPHRTRAGCDRWRGSRDRCEGPGSTSTSGVLTRLGPTTAGVVVRLVLLLRTAVLLGSATRGGARRADARRDHSVTLRPAERKPDRVAESSAVTGENHASIAENACVCWAHCPVGVAETPTVQGGVSATQSAIRGGFGNESGGFGNPAGVSVRGL